MATTKKSENVAPEPTAPEPTAPEPAVEAPKRPMGPRLREIVEGVVSLRAEWAAIQSEIGEDGTEAAGALAEVLEAKGARLEDDTNPWPLKHMVERSPGGADPFVRAATGIVAMIAAGERAVAHGLAARDGLKRFAKVALETKNRAGAIHALDALRAEDERARTAKHAIEQDARGAKKAPSPPHPAPATGAPPSLRTNPLLTPPEEPKV